MNTPFRYDYVGSFLRPTALKEARADYEAGKISKETLTEVENAAITDLIKKQKKAGYHVITDGEFRRATWHLDFMWAFEGVEHKKTQTGVPFHDEVAMIDDTYLIDKISINHHPFVEHFKFVKQFEDKDTVAKQTIPAPDQFLQQMLFSNNIEQTNKIYPDRKELIEDIAKGYKKVIDELYQAGCRNIQFDDCAIALCANPAAAEYMQTDEAGLKAMEKELLIVNNLVIDGKPDDLVINTHVCRGNYHSTYAGEGAYDTVAKTLFVEENVNAYYLEFDDERSGGFESLKLVPKNKKVVLGLITTKSPVLENKQTIIDRIYEAAKYIPLDNLCLSPQCGFASCEIGNKLTEEEQWAKLALVKEIAEEVWK
ncbi:MAG: 5-methyltetrahydropteroyltriglutamate--homocysteine S-methyltransferase [Eubacterium sp.]